MAEVMAFKVDIPSTKVERLQRKLRDTRLPGRPIVPDAGTSYGMHRSSKMPASHL